MDPRDRDLLNRTFDYVRENNKMLKKMRAVMRWNSFLKFLFWMIIILSTIWLYYRFEPFVSEVIGTFNEVKSGFDSLSLPK